MRLSRLLWLSNNKSNRCKWRMTWSRLVWAWKWATSLKKLRAVTLSRQLRRHPLKLTLARHKQLTEQEARKPRPKRHRLQTWRVKNPRSDQQSALSR